MTNYQTIFREAHPKVNCVDCKKAVKYSIKRGFQKRCSRCEKKFKVKKAKEIF